MIGFNTDIFSEDAGEMSAAAAPEYFQVVGNTALGWIFQADIKTSAWSGFPGDIDKTICAFSQLLPAGGFIFARAVVVG